MQNAAAIFTGIVHGKSIELDRATDLPDGEPVEVTVLPQTQRSMNGEGIRSSAGAWSQDADELDQFLKWNRQQRKLIRPEADELSVNVAGLRIDDWLAP